MKPGLHVGNNADGSRIEVPFEVFALERAIQLQGEVDAFVTANVHPKEREALSSIAAGLDELRDYVRPLTDLEQGVRVGLILARQWMHEAIGLGGLAKIQCFACNTIEELADVVVDVTVLGPPPTVTAGEIAVALRGDA